MTVLFLLGIWSVFGKRTVVTGCCPYSVLEWNSQVRTGLLLTEDFLLLFLNNNNNRGANIKIPGLINVYSTVYCRSRRLYFIVIWASKYLFLKEHSLNNVFKQTKFMVYWLVTLRCSLVNSLYISDFAELIHCPWKIFSWFFPSVPMLLEAEGDH